MLTTSVFAADAPVGVSPNLPDPYKAPPATGTTIKTASGQEYHVFTDAKGNPMTAQVLGMVGTTVNLRRDDGQNVQAALASFPKSDQTYVVEMLLRQFTARDQAVFDFSAVTAKTNPASAKIDGGTRMTWKENFRITVKNETLLALDNLQARIIVFKAVQLPDVPGAVKSSMVLLGESQNLATIPSNGKITVDSNQVSMTQILANDGGQFPDAPAVHTKTDKLLAVWIRIYDSNNYPVQEWCSLPSVAKQQPWDDAWAMATGSTPTRR